MSLDLTMREIMREVLREEIGPLREEVHAALHASAAQIGQRSDEQGLLTVEQAAAVLNVTEATVRGWIKSGALHAVRPRSAGKAGRMFRISRSDLDAFIHAGEGPAGPAGPSVKEEAANILAFVGRKRDV